MTLKLNRDAKVTWALTRQHLVRPADDDDFGTERLGGRRILYKQEQSRP